MTPNYLPPFLDQEIYVMHQSMHHRDYIGSTPHHETTSVVRAISVYGPSLRNSFLSNLQMVTINNCFKLYFKNNYSNMLLNQDKKKLSIFFSG